MKLVIQRVKKASVSLAKEGGVVGSISSGLFILFGVKKDDTIDQAAVLASKLVKMRLMADKDQKMNLSALEFLIVSQFTLYGDTSKGNRPSFVKAGDPKAAKEIYDHFVNTLKKLLKDNPKAKVATGKFGEYMEIDAELDGPVTIVQES